ncbi:hypothetical protein BV25DRAFT_362432 [Artomyces pyxidatus]|uniref:Uncharacterized protein n=1 Tax=Artomyces pyxidatus TaxID=48021 RepID=A0ACB8T510_9AGAM|nr:hypothetical protein BV25DRAFT_362432 [Artomyces pyxidatus]
MAKYHSFAPTSSTLIPLLAHLLLMSDEDLGAARTTLRKADSDPAPSLSEIIGNVLIAAVTCLIVGFFVYLVWEMLKLVWKWLYNIWRWVQDRYSEIARKKRLAAANKDRYEESDEDEPPRVHRVKYVPYAYDEGRSSARDLYQPGQAYQRPSRPTQAAQPTTYGQASVRRQPPIQHYENPQTSSRSQARQQPRTTTVDRAVGGDEPVFQRHAGPSLKDRAPPAPPLVVRQQAVPRHVQTTVQHVITTQQRTLITAVSPRGISRDRTSS